MAHLSEPNSIASRPGLSSSGLGKGLLSPLSFGLVCCGGVGAVLFTATYLLEGITRQGYDAWQQPISALSLGPGGWVQQVNFVVFGILLILSAVGWYRFLTPGKGAIWFPLLQSLSGLGLIGAGLFLWTHFPAIHQGPPPRQYRRCMEHCIQSLRGRSFLPWLRAASPWLYTLSTCPIGAGGLCTHGLLAC